MVSLSSFWDRKYTFICRDICCSNFVYHFSYCDSIFRIYRRRFGIYFQNPAPEGLTCQKHIIGCIKDWDKRALERVYCLLLEFHVIIKCIFGRFECPLLLFLIFIRIILNIHHFYYPHALMCTIPCGFHKQIIVG